MKKVNNNYQVLPWVIWATGALFITYQFLLQSSPSVMIPELVLSLHIDLEEVGFLTSYFFYTYILMQLPVGILVDIVGPKILLIAGGLLCGVASIGFSQCQCLWQAKSARLVMGLMSSPAFVSVIYLATRWFDHKKLALVVGLTETLGMIGAGTGTILLTYLVSNWGWRKSVLICGYVGISLAFLILLIVRNAPKESNLSSAEKTSINFQEEKTNLWLVLKNSQIWISGLFSGLVFSIIPAYFGLWGILFITDTYQVNPACAAGVMWSGFVGAGIGGPTYGWLSNYLKRKKILMVFSSLMAFIVSILLFHLKIHIAWVYPLNFLLGFFSASYILTYILVKEITPSSAHGKAIGVANMLSLVFGAPIIQPLVGIISNQGGGMTPRFPLALTVLSFALLLAFVISFFIKETHCRSLDAPTA